MKNKHSSFEQDNIYFAKKNAGLFFFGVADVKICIITGNTGGIDWHHLDERNDNNPRNGANLIPIAATLNKNIDDDNKERKIKRYGLVQELELNDLRSLSESYWRNGDFPACYGVNRLGAFLFTNNYWKPTASLSFATEALHSLRPLWKEDFAIDTIERNVIPILGTLRQGSIDAKASLCKEIASWYLSSNDSVYFQKWRTLSNRFSAIAKKIASSDDSVETRARMLQHLAFFHYQQRNYILAAKLLKKADEIMKEIGYNHGISNNHQYFIRLILQDTSIPLTKRIDLAEERMKLVEKEFGKITEDIIDWRFQKYNNLEFWSGIALYQLKAELFYRKSVNRKWRHHQVYYNCAFNFINKISRFLEDKKVQALTVFPDSVILANLDKFRLDYNKVALTGFIKHPKLDLPIRASFDRVYKLLRETSLDIFKKTKTSFP